MVHVTETELFRPVHILLLDINKKHLDELKAKISLMANMDMDNSGLLRALLEFIYDRQELLEDIVPYARKYKGFMILQQFLEMIQEQKTPEEIEEELGISAALAEELIKKNGQK